MVFTAFRSGHWGEWLTATARRVTVPGSAGRVLGCFGEDKGPAYPRMLYW